MIVSEAVAILEKHAPRGLAEEWDNVGLIIGDPGWKCDRVVAGVDLTLDLVERAQSEKAGLIVCHHPPIFRPVKSLVRGRENEISTLLLRCVQAQIAVVACHTNFDQSALEVCEKVVNGLGLFPRGRLVSDSTFLKLVTYVPGEHYAKVRDAVFEAGAGRVGAYDQCAFDSTGIGGYRPGEGTNPFRGSVGVRETVQETRFETVLPVGLKNRVVSALIKAHPYEEVAYEFMPIEIPRFKKGLWSGIGYGVWGEAAQPIELEELLSRARKTFGVSQIRVSGTPRPVKKIAFCAGKATSFVATATSLGIDAFIVGEVDYHSALSRTRAGQLTLELGHTESERFFPEVILGWLEAL